MTRPAILQPGQSDTFRKYFELAFATEDVLAEFNCTFGKESLHFSQPAIELNCSELKQRLEESLTFVDLNIEAARTE